MPITDADRAMLAEMDAAEKKATPGEWGWNSVDADGDFPLDLPPSQCLLAGCDYPGSRHEGLGHTVEDCGNPILRCERQLDDDGADDPWPSPEDARFIALARNSARRLLDIVREQGERIAELETELAALRQKQS